MGSTTSPAFTPPDSPTRHEEETLETMLRHAAELSIRIQHKYATLKQNPDAKYYTYVLLLQQGYMYVGNSDNIYQRLTHHFLLSPQSSQWVREHGPVTRVVEIIQNSHPDTELYKTLEWCELVGYEKVRGAAYCKLECRGPPPPLASFQRDPGRPFQYLSRQDIDGIVHVAKRLASLSNVA